MSTPFLLNFARHILDALRQRRLIELVDGGQERAAEDLANHLTRIQHSSLITELSRALLRSEAVAELFASDEELKEVVEGLDASVIRS